MSFNKYYQEELLYLREMGEEFARAYPKLAPFLSRKGNDPDVERIIEGFAFIAGRIRQKLDDELPELTHTLISLMWPHFLRPIPAMSILQFAPKPNSTISEKTFIARGAEADSVSVDGTLCRFRTCYEVNLYPFTLKELEVQTTGAGSTLKISFELAKGANFKAIKLDTLRLFLHGEAAVCHTLYLWLFQYLTRITVRGDGPEKNAARVELDPTNIVRVGFDDADALIPYPANAFSGYRLLQEYFCLPQKFLFADVKGLSKAADLPVENRFSMVFEFSRPFENQLRLSKSNLQLYCSPVINIFKKDAAPIRLNNEKVEYRVVPAGGDSRHYDISSVDAVMGWAQGSGEKKSYLPFISFERSAPGKQQSDTFFRTRPHPSVTGSESETWITFVSASDRPQLPKAETISIEMTCTNRYLPEKLRIGDINTPTGNSPEFAVFQNIIPCTRSVPPPLGGNLQWMLISNMALNYTSLTNIDALRQILSSYNFPALYDQQAARVSELRLEGIASIRVAPMTLMFHGLPARGLRTSLRMQSSKFSNPGDMYLFASVLNEFFALYTSINSFNQLNVKDVERGEEFIWQPRVGQQPVI